MILVIDNYDSFVHNLARYVSELGEQPVVLRHDATTLQEIETLQPSHIIDLVTHFFSKTRWKRTLNLIHGYPIQ